MALAQGNYGRFFKLYLDAPNMNGYLMESFLDKYRTLCLQTLTIGHVQGKLELTDLKRLLAFESLDEIT